MGSGYRTRLSGCGGWCGSGCDEMAGGRDWAAEKCARMECIAKGLECPSYTYIFCTHGTDTPGPLFAPIHTALHFSAAQVQSPVIETELLRRAGKNILRTAA